MSVSWNERNNEEDSDGIPHFGRKGKQWLARHLRTWLLQNGGTIPWRMVIGEVTPIVEWFCEQPLRYIMWKDATEYHGKGYSFGAWIVHWDIVKDDLADGLQKLRAQKAQAADASRITSLDDWLRADIGGTLEYRGAQGGTAQLSKELRERLARAALRRRRYWHRACDDCGESFVPKRRNGRRCEECLARRTGKMTS
jgi:hypothetical protein